MDRRGMSDAGGNTRRHTDQGGQPFTMYKFRTMRPGGAGDSQTWAAPDAERVTPVGRVLRKLPPDELPQRSNVLMGDTTSGAPGPAPATICSYLPECAG